MVLQILGGGDIYIFLQTSKEVPSTEFKDTRERKRNKVLMASWSTITKSLECRAKLHVYPSVVNRQPGHCRIQTSNCSNPCGSLPQIVPTLVSSSKCDAKSSGVSDCPFISSILYPAYCQTQSSTLDSGELRLPLKPHWRVTSLLQE